MREKICDQGWHPLSRPQRPPQNAALIVLGGSKNRGVWPIVTGSPVCIIRDAVRLFFDMSQRSSNLPQQPLVAKRRYENEITSSWAGSLQGIGHILLVTRGGSTQLLTGITMIFARWRVCLFAETRVRMVFHLI